MFYVTHVTEEKNLALKSFSFTVGGLTVDVLADVFPLRTAVLVIPLSKARSYYLTTVFPGFIAPVIRLALHPVSETRETLFWINFSKKDCYHTLIHVQL